MTQPVLFDVTPVATTRKPKTAGAAPSWTTNTTKTTCYDCVTRLAAGEHVTAMRAQWRRTHGESVGLYCYWHATSRRDADHKATQRAA